MSYNDISGRTKEEVLRNFELLMQGHQFNTKVIPVHVTRTTVVMERPTVVRSPVPIKDMRSDDSFWRKD